MYQLHHMTYLILSGVVLKFSFAHIPLDGKEIVDTIEENNAADELVKDTVKETLTAIFEPMGPLKILKLLYYAKEMIDDEKQLKEHSNKHFKDHTYKLPQPDLVEHLEHIGPLIKFLITKGLLEKGILDKLDIGPELLDTMPGLDLLGKGLEDHLEYIGPLIKLLIAKGLLEKDILDKLDLGPELLDKIPGLDLLDKGLEDHLEHIGPLIKLFIGKGLLGKDILDKLDIGHELLEKIPGIDLLDEGLEDHLEHIGPLIKLLITKGLLGKDILDKLDLGHEILDNIPGLDLLDEGLEDHLEHIGPLIKLLITKGLLGKDILDKLHLVHELPDKHHLITLLKLLFDKKKLSKAPDLFDTDTDELGPLLKLLVTKLLSNTDIFDKHNLHDNDFETLIPLLVEKGPVDNLNPLLKLFIDEGTFYNVFDKYLDEHTGHEDLEDHHVEFFKRLSPLIKLILDKILSQKGFHDSEDEIELILKLIIEHLGKHHKPPADDCHIPAIPPHTDGCHIPQIPPPADDCHIPPIPPPCDDCHISSIPPPLDDCHIPHVLLHPAPPHHIPRVLPPVTIPRTAHHTHGLHHTPHLVTPLHISHLPNDNPKKIPYPHIEYNVPLPKPAVPLFDPSDDCPPVTPLDPSNDWREYYLRLLDQIAVDIPSVPVDGCFDSRH